MNLPTRPPSHVFFGKPPVMAVYFTHIFLSCRTLAFAIGIGIFALSSASTVWSQDPVVDRLDVSSFGPGQNATVVVNGKQLTGALGLWTPWGTLRPKEGTDLTKDQAFVVEGIIAADAVPGIYPARVITSHGCSEAAFVVIDDLPSVTLTAESEDRASGQLISVPCCVGGQIKPVVSRFLRVSMSPGQTLSMEILARRLGSELDPLLRVTDPHGNEVAYRDDLPGAEGDTQLQFTAAVAGEYRIEVRDVRYSGGARHFFHLRLGRLSLVSRPFPTVINAGGKVSVLDSNGAVLGEASASVLPDQSGLLVPLSFKAQDADGSVIASVLATNGVAQSESEPNNTQSDATAISAESHVLSGKLQEKGDIDWFKFSVTEATPLLVVARTRETGSAADLLLELYNSQGGKMVESDDAGARDAELAAQLPAAGDFYLKVSDIAGRGGSEWAYTLDVFRGRKAVRITAPADRINVPRGGSASMMLNVRRVQYDGPLKVEAVGLPSAIVMSPVTIGPKQSAVPVVLTAVDPAATSSDADWAPVSFRVSAPDDMPLSNAELQLAPPAPKKTDAEIFRSARLRGDLFVAVQPAAQFSMTVEPAVVTLQPGETASVLVKSTRAAEWTMPIEIALAIPADQLPSGVTVTGGAMAANELAVTISASGDAPAGAFTVFLQGKAKKDKLEPVHPVPPIVVEVKAK